MDIVAVERNTCKERRTINVDDVNNKYDHNKELKISLLCCFYLSIHDTHKNKTNTNKTVPIGW